jgi:hypothetical protein
MNTKQLVERRLSLIAACKIGEVEPAVMAAFMSEILFLESLLESIKHNGYANRATWLVSLWLDNNRVSYEHFTRRAKALGNEYLLADEIQIWVEDNMPMVNDGTLYADLVGYAVCEVDFQELAAGFLSC